MASPFSFLRAGPPPPRVAPLPDGVFFTRAVPITAGATAAEAATQVELALEASSPFPLAQLYYGWFWAAGAEHAFVFASYRRRFTTDQTAEWQDAELVMPAFATVFGAEVSPATTIILSSAEGLTAVHWDAPPVPAKVLFQPVAAEATDEDRAKARDELLRGFDGSRKVIDVTSPLVADAAQSDRELVFRSGDFVSRLPAAVAANLDVRDKAELAALRAARSRDIILWRVTMACAATLLLLLLGEFALVGGKAWQNVRLRQVRAQKPAVEKIMASQEMARRIDDLATKRLLPFEMITQLFDENRKPAEIKFQTVIASTADLHSLRVDGLSTNADQVNVYLATLRAVPTIARVENVDFRIRGNAANFTILVTFKPDALKAAETIVSQ